MKTKASYLVIDKNRGTPTIVRVTQSWPTLNPGEMAVRLRLEIPDSTFPMHEIVIDEPAAMLEAVGVAADPPEEEED